MSFDIFQLDDKDLVEDELYEYQDELIELFADSPEGKARAQADPDMGFWVARLIDYGYSYTGTTPTLMTDDDIEELLTDVFPRKVSLNAPEDADDALPALIAFWEYLKREYKLSNADHILSYLRSVRPEEFKKWMNDSSRFGMAKSIFMMGQSAGFDMTDEKDSTAFINRYNANLLSSRQSDPSLALGTRESDLSFALGIGGEKKKADPKAKRRRKIAKESRKKNRKRK
ncbi:MAG: hypothetical protein ACREAB_11215 [Blastocatellia bacterium]